MVVSDPQSKAEAPRGAVRKRRSSGVVVPHEPYWYQRLGAWAVFLLVRVVSATLRYQWTDRSGYFEDGPAGPAIYCVWHNRLALCLIEYYGYVKKHNQTPGMAALVSASKDGGFLAGVLECFKVQPVRGSSSRRGPQALLELSAATIWPSPPTDRADRATWCRKASWGWRRSPASRSSRPHTI